MSVRAKKEQEQWCTLHKPPRAALQLKSVLATCKARTDGHSTLYTRASLQKPQDLQPEPLACVTEQYRKLPARPSVRSSYSISISALTHHVPGQHKPQVPWCHVNVESLVSFWMWERPINALVAQVAPSPTHLPNHRLQLWSDRGTRGFATYSISTETTSVEGDTKLRPQKIVANTDTTAIFKPGTVTNDKLGNCT